MPSEPHFPLTLPSPSGRGEVDGRRIREKLQNLRLNLLQPRRYPLIRQIKLIILIQHQPDKLPGLKRGGKGKIIPVAWPLTDNLRATAHHRVIERAQRTGKVIRISLLIAKPNKATILPLRLASAS
jgi:hypothetical protein